MKEILLISAAHGDDNKELAMDTYLSNSEYSFTKVLYNDNNTYSRINSLHSRLKAKIPRMMDWLRHPGYDYYIWVDSKFTILDGFAENIMEFADMDYDLFLFAHTTRNSIKDELDYINMKMSEGNKYLIDRYGGEPMSDQVATYLSDETFTDNKLFATGCFMYTNKLVQNRDYNIMTDWFLHNVLYSIEDQLSLPYLLHKHKTRYKVYPHVLMKNDFLIHDFGRSF